MICFRSLLRAARWRFLFFCGFVARRVLCAAADRHLGAFAALHLEAKQCQTATVVFFLFCFYCRKGCQSHVISVSNCQSSFFFFLQKRLPKSRDFRKRGFIGSVHKGSDELPLSPEVGISVSGLLPVFIRIRNQTR